MMQGKFSIEAIGFDPERHCVYPSDLSGLLPPLPMPVKLRDCLTLFEYQGSPEQKHEAFMQGLERLVAPIVVPRTNLERVADANKIIVMSPTTGHTPTAYDFASRQDQMIFLSNQVLATGWEITRQALLSLGATVKISEDIYTKKGIAPVMAEDGIQLPVQQTFSRDAGVAIDNLFLTPSEGALYRTGIDIIETSHHVRVPPNSRADKFTQLTAGLKPHHARAIVKAYREAGVNLKFSPVDAFFEAGDVISDPRKGLVLIGNDQSYNQKFASLRTNAATLRQAFANVAGERSAPNFIERPLSEYSENRVDGERFHLDCFMSLLPQGEMLVDPHYTTPASLDQLRKIYGDNLILIDDTNPRKTREPIGTGDVPNCIANLVSVGNTLVIPSCSKTLKGTLEQRGYTIITAADLGTTPGAFYMRGGGMHCITNDFPSPA